MIIKQKGVKPKELSTVSTPNSIPYLVIEAIERGEIRQYADSHSTIHSTEDDIFVVADGARNGLILPGKKGAVGSTLFCLTPLWIDKDYLYYFLKLNEIQRRDTRHIENNFWDIQVPIVSLEKQKQIASSIKDALSIFEQQNKEAELNLIKSLKSLVNIYSGTLENIQNLDDFKNAVLSLAISGELTNSLRKKNNFPNSKKVQLKEVCSEIETGETPKIFSNNENDVPFLKVYNLRNNTIDFFHKPQYVSSENLTNRLLKTAVFPNDVLMNIVGPPLGKVALIPNTIKSALINQAIAFFRVDESKLHAKYLFYSLLEGSPLRRIFPKLRGNAGQLNVSINQCRELFINLPPIEEQKEIINIIDDIFKVADNINFNYFSDKLKQDELHKSILSSFYKDLVFDGNIEEILLKIEEARIKKNAEITHLKTKQKQFREKLSALPKMEIIDILESTNTPLFINELWEKSKYNGNIDAFYEALKQEIENKKITWILTDEESAEPKTQISLNHQSA